ncbi:diaminopimelate decarboxylase [Pseudemcibacter aquimaris]|uniref:diaminopimelate decarboxylase n=1 Tax=Pseudemcibacter aquimaris TaxID=2857064 RepID=UPI002012F1D7|nr:diaminopimelate decarboxylase [Pseudemcibacter aquimaris]MCC3861622.1 diaminopimelate decarboxylase [Pseudemcibacter aquimaris]WDU58391.1 diaminopimelate decarboxylase [Pseudemcibacter aquimaris]
MNYFEYRDGEMVVENKKISDIADSVGTPFYLYSSASLAYQYNQFKEAFGDIDLLICYAVKANTNQAVIKTFADLGAGADVVSEGEMRRALKAGIPASKIVYSGVAKTVQEMTYALEQGIFQFNVESEPELYQLSQVADNLGKTANITFRVNPDVDAKTHAKISTGKSENKFGVPWKNVRALCADAAKLPGIKLVGLDLHIGSQITELDPFEEAFTRVCDLVEVLREDGHDLTRLDLGGGLGIPYEGDDFPPLPREYAEMVKRVTNHLGCKIIIEPGRFLVGNAGVLVSKVVYVKKGEERKFLIIDAAMNDLVRPSMYDAYHGIDPIKESDQERTLYDVVGPVCETGDTFATNRLIEPMESGDLLAIRSVGAYGAVMSGTYNTRKLIPEVLVNNDEFAVVRPRPSYDDIIGLDQLPPWLSK